MSTQYVAYIIYGFPSDSPVTRDRKTGECTYLGDWLAGQRHICEQHNAGVSNGGRPKFLVGHVVAKLRDFTRLVRPYEKLHPLAVTPEMVSDVERARVVLRAINPELAPESDEVGFYLCGEVA